MTDNFRLAAELGLQLREQRRVLKLSKSELGVRAGKVREVVSRLENGQDSTISSLAKCAHPPKIGHFVKLVPIARRLALSSRFQVHVDMHR